MTATATLALKNPDSSWQQFLDLLAIEDRDVLVNSIDEIEVKVVEKLSI